MNSKAALTLVLLVVACPASLGWQSQPRRQCRRHGALWGASEGKASTSSSDPTVPLMTDRASFLSFVAGTIALVATRPAVARANDTPASRPDAGSQPSILSKSQRVEPSSSLLSSRRENARRESLSGFFAGAALTLTKTIVKYPLDTATVRLQMPHTAYSIRRPMELLANAYVGITVPLVSNVPAGAVFFAVKDAVKTSLSDSVWSSFDKTLLSVAMAQIPYWLLRNPTEVVKTRQQAGQEQYTATNTTGILQIYQQVRVDALQGGNDTSWTDGWDAYYTGYWENVGYAYPADVIKFATYEWLSGLSSSTAALSPATGAAYGAVATAVAQCVTTPLDVVRNRVMAHRGGNDATHALSYTDTLVQLARDEGLAGLFAGVTPRVGKAILSGAIQFATYEETKQEFAKLFSEKR